MLTRRAIHYRENIEHRREYNKRRSLLPEVKKKRAQLDKKCALLHPEKYKARYMAKNAITQGKLKRKSCQVCGEENAQAHHEDYSKPLDITWLCFKHHIEVHGKATYEERLK